MADLPREMQRGSQSRTRRVDGGPYAGLYHQGVSIHRVYQELTPSGEEEEEEEEGCYIKKKKTITHKQAQNDEVCYSVLRTDINITTCYPRLKAD